MLARITNLLKQPLTWIGLGIALLALVAGLGWSVRQTQLPPEQPLQFPHNLHVGLGVQCLYCHPGAWTGASAGLPTQAKCWGCHQQIQIRAGSQLEILRDYVERDETIPWVPVAIMPEFVHFMHRPHVAAGLNCENCHGEIGQMTVAVPVYEMNMGWCLDCHRTRAADDPEKLIKLTDCVTCHY